MGTNHNGNRYHAAVNASPEMTDIATRSINYQQLIKWTVYILLLVNWALYFREEWINAQYTLHNGGSLLDWADAFRTSLDEAAWFGLLFLWELETYALSEEHWNRLLQRVFLLIRGACYIFLAHTVFAAGSAWMELRHAEASPEIANLCEISDQGISFTHNLDYIPIERVNCAGISPGPDFFFVDNAAVTDRAGLAVERRSAWFDLQDAVTWLLIMFTIEVGIWLQERNITGGPVMLVTRLGKALYGVLFLDAAYWAWMGHWLYTWDQLLWICGFWMIEFNLKEWRASIDSDTQKAEPTAAD